MPGPVLFWLGALSAVAIGLRGSRTPRVPATSGLPLVLRLGTRCPAPSGLVRALRRHHRPGDIDAAGLDGMLDADALGRIRAGLVTVALVVGGVLAVASPVAAVLAVPLMVIGVMLPSLLIARRARGRRRALVADLPDLIDMVVLCTDAGLPLESSLRVAVDRFTGVLAEEIRAVLVRLDLGTPRRVAYRGLAARMDVRELTSLVGAILQAEELGTPISGVLSRQADLLRVNRRQAIRDHAAQAAPKVQLVVAMIMVPGALLLVVGVMILRLIGELGVVIGTGP